MTTRSEYVPFRLTPSELKDLERMAKKLRVSKSELIRAALSCYIEKGPAVLGHVRGQKANA